MAVSAIINELGDLLLLNETVEINDATSASVYEYMKRAVDFCCKLAVDCMKTDNEKVQRGP